MWKLNRQKIEMLKTEASGRGGCYKNLVSAI